VSPPSPISCPPAPMRFEISIAYRELKNDVSATDDLMKKSKHWLLVVTRPDNRELDSIIELRRLEKIWVHYNGHSNLFIPKIYPVATYEGLRNDFDHVLFHHPMNRNPEYKPGLNNCQHFVATFLLFLKAFAYQQQDTGRSFWPGSRYYDILSVLGTGERDGERVLWNLPNPYLSSISAVASLGLTGATGIAAAGAAATKITEVAVPVAGFLGRLGVTQTVAVTVPTVGAGLAAAAVPALIAGAVGVGGITAARCHIWKKKTTFRDPDLYGFPG